MGYDDGSYTAGFFDRSWYFGTNIDEVAELTEEADRHHWLRVRHRREKLRESAAVVPAEASAAMEPTPQPSQALVDHIAEQIRNPRASRTTVRRTPDYGGGVDL